MILQPKFATRFHKNSVGICISDKNPDTVWFADHITAELFKSYYRGVSGFLKVGGQVVMHIDLTTYHARCKTEVGMYIYTTNI